MPLTLRGATPADIDPMATLLHEDARARQRRDPALWRLADDARQRIVQALTRALGPGDQPVRQAWWIAEDGARLAGLAHAMHLPVPPIYAGRFGEPGLLLADGALAAGAPPDTGARLRAAAEAGLREAGASLLLSATLPGGAGQAALARAGYVPLTLYLTKSGLETAAPAGVRAATEADVPAITTLSAANRATLAALDPFWVPHPEADARFAAWMTRSLTLTDRDMRVAGTGPAMTGYVIAQPATPLHFPAAHDFSGIGVIDDYYATEFADPAALSGSGGSAAALLQAAEAACAGRGRDTALVVCPAAWHSKIALLEQAGYAPGLIWMIKRG
ncbi:hypothetical protein [Frigidibacter sp. ROC022]|uniref:hypothetical protein n=1 Tax=Frigidibacter sp. ROC022 TaxID=2971796 RepID=UPI00215A66DB|nr:hypothetical protein [Frigidibacter sp. ROC022]MCR8724239.1 hypothetical protein [Frigidibacter sp. ROC022]